MTSAPTAQPTTSAAEAAGPLRLELKPEAPATGVVDGAWWPRSWDLATELPSLLAGLAQRLGRVERVSYNLDTWQPIPTKVSVDGAVVRLAGFHTQPAGSIDVISAREQLTLLVVPPDASEEVADSALAAAGREGNADGIDDLLSGRGQAGGGTRPTVRRGATRRRG